MHDLQPHAHAPADDRPLASVIHLGSALGNHDDWLAAIDRAWDRRRLDSGRLRGLLREVRAVRLAADRVGDEFVVAAADVVLLREVVEQGRLGDAVAGLVPAAADLETYPASVWLGRAHGALGTAFARLGEHDRARDHLQLQRDVGEVVDDLVLQAQSLHDLALLDEPGSETLEALAAAEILYTRASVDRPEAPVGRLLTRLDRAETTLDLGLVASGAEQLSSVVELAATLQRPAEQARALALLGRCAGLSGDVDHGLRLARRSAELADHLPAVVRHDVAVTCAAAYMACRRADLAVEVLDVPSLRDDRDGLRRARLLSGLADAYERLGRDEDAFRALREADRITQVRVAEAERTRLEALRAYHRARSAETELSTQRDLSARLLEQVGDLAEANQGSGEVVVRDETTGLPNRRYLDLELRWRCSQRLPGRSLLVLVLVSVDPGTGRAAVPGRALAAEGPELVDGIDDAAGRLHGDDRDRVVAVVGQVLRDNVRSGDAVARYGSTTFAVVQLHRSLDAARFAGERLRNAVSAYPWAEQRLGRTVTASIGVAALHPPTTPGTLVARATAALDAATESGGDRVHVAGA